MITRRIDGLERLTLDGLHALLEQVGPDSPRAPEIKAEIARRLTPKKRRPTLAERRMDLEKDVQREVVKLLERHGAKVYDTSQPFRAAITPGVPDLIVFLPPPRGLVFVECKRPGGKPSPAQLEFAARCVQAGIEYVLGGVAEVTAYLNGE